MSNYVVRYKVGKKFMSQEDYDATVTRVYATRNEVSSNCYLMALMILIHDKIERDTHNGINKTSEERAKEVDSFLASMLVDVDSVKPNDVTYTVS